MVKLANFESKEYPNLAKLADSAELLMYSDAKSSLTIFGSFAEQLTKLIFRLDGMKDWNLQQNERILHMQASSNEYPSSVTAALDKIRRLRNKAAHEADFHPSLEVALYIDQEAFFVWCWFLETFTQADIKPYQKPVDQQTMVADQQKKIEQLTAEIEKLQHTQPVEVPESVRAERRRKNRKFAAKNKLSEAQTREIIDQQLRDAGWEADSKNLNNWTKGTLPRKGHNMAIAEWKLPHSKERADYVLFSGERAVGIIEAKKYEEPVAADALNQAYDYYKHLKNAGDVVAEGRKPYAMDSAVFLFGANGRPYLSQMKNQSGIWFRDLRNKNHPDCPLESWLTPDDIKMKEMARPEEDADAALQNDNDYPDFAGRYYQKLAIQEIEKAIGEHNIVSCWPWQRAQGRRVRP